MISLFPDTSSKFEKIDAAVKRDYRPRLCETALTTTGLTEDFSPRTGKAAADGSFVFRISCLNAEETDRLSARSKKSGEIYASP